MRSSTNPPAAVVTGGSSGIGLAIVERFLADGLSVVIADISEPPPALLDPHSERAIFVHCDVRQMEDARRAADTAIETFGGIQILVTSAGIGEQISFFDQKPEDYENLVDINLTGAYRLMKTCVPPMRDAGFGRVVHIASIAALQGISGRIAYCSAKHGIIGLTRATALELGAFGITVNAVCPGPIDTPFVKRIHTEETRKSYLSKVPLNRYGKPEEVADTVAFLVKPESEYLNGVALPLDGGLTGIAAMFAL